MAVPKKKIKERLAELFPKAKNLGRARMAKLTAALAKLPADDADDDAIDEVIMQYDEAFSIEEMAAQDDTIRTLRTKIKNSSKPSEEEEDDDDDPADPADPDPANPKPKPTDEMPGWAKSMMGSVQKLAEDVSSIKSGKFLETKQSTVSKMFAESEVLKKLPESMQKRLAKTIDFDSDESIEDQVAELEEENEGFLQNLKDSTDVSSGPSVNTGGAKVSEKEVEDVVSEM